MTPLHIDLGYSQRCKYGENICGDAFKFQKNDDGGRVVAVLSDGLGSGVKANILASMTATMALKFASESSDRILHAADIMMDALPICQVRKISYATFTIVNIDMRGDARIIEMGNPGFLLLRKGSVLDVPFQEMESEKWQDRRMKVYDFSLETTDRLVFFSDGISQAGMGTRAYPLGWRRQGCGEYVQRRVADRPDISSHELSEDIIRQARLKEPNGVNNDDMTCVGLYFRHPRKMLLFTGPPYDGKRDAECAEVIANYEGTKVISGGTSAEIISRILGRKLKMDLKNLHPEMPPMSTMDGIDLVTEGIFTLTKTAQYLEKYDGVHHDNPAGKLVDLMLQNDIIEILVGTRINEAHQDPRLPQDLELRRNIIKRIASTLEANFLKRVTIKYV